MPNEPIIVAILAIILIRLPFTIASLWKIFEHSNLKGWKSLIPGLNLVLLIKLSKRPLFHALLFLIPLINIALFYIVIYNLTNKEAPSVPNIIRGTAYTFLFGGVYLSRIVFLSMEKIIEKLFFVIALSCLVALLSIIIFLILDGLPIFEKISIKDFILGTEWYPTNEENPRFGILPLIAASVSVTFLASVIAVPLSIGIAIYLSQLASNRVREIIKPIIEIIASIPSVIIGFFGMVVVAPLLQSYFNIDTGLNMFNASIMLAFMAIPTIASISEDAISSVPRSLIEASYALGADRWETIFHITLPASLSGIWTAVILGISRVIGETMVVLMVAGGAQNFPNSIFAPVRPLTSNIAAEMAEAPYQSDHYYALFAIGIILFIITFIFNLIADYLSNKYKFKEN